MSITSTIEGGIVVNVVGEEDTSDDVFAFIVEHIDQWTDTSILWDATRFDFNRLDSAAVRSILEKGAPIAALRAGCKSAIVVNSDVGFGMMRMLQLLAEISMPIHYKVFRTRAEALLWFED